MNALTARLTRLESTINPKVTRGMIFVLGAGDINSITSYVETSEGKYTEENHTSVDAAQEKYPGVNVLLTNYPETIILTKRIIRGDIWK